MRKRDGSEFLKYICLPNICKHVALTSKMWYCWNILISQICSNIWNSPQICGIVLPNILQIFEVHLKDVILLRALFGPVAVSQLVTVLWQPAFIVVIVVIKIITIITIILKMMISTLRAWQGQRCPAPRPFARSRPPCAPSDPGNYYFHEENSDHFYEWISW